jgi:hypothetical protein
MLLFPHIAKELIYKHMTPPIGFHIYFPSENILMQLRADYGHTSGINLEDDR